VRSYIAYSPAAGDGRLIPVGRIERAQQDDQFTVYFPQERSAENRSEGQKARTLAELKPLLYQYEPDVFCKSRRSKELFNKIPENGMAYYVIDATLCHRHN